MKYRIKDKNGLIKFVGLESWFSLEQAIELKMDGDSIIRVSSVEAFYEYDKEDNELWETFKKNIKK